MTQIHVHPRVTQRHPDVSNDDVVCAVKNMFRYAQRSTGEWIAIGLDTNNRILELVYQYSFLHESFLVYHAMPVTRKTMKELNAGRNN